MEQKIRSLIKEAMLEKNKNKQLTYKSILETAQKIAKNDGNRAITDDDFIKAVKTEIKLLNDLKEYVMFGSPEESDIIEKINYCEILLPKMASREDILSFLELNNIDKNIGICMKSLKAQFGETLDGKFAQNIVKEYLSVSTELEK